MLILPMPISAMGTIVARYSLGEFPVNLFVIDIIVCRCTFRRCLVVPLMTLPAANHVIVYILIVIRHNVIEFGYEYNIVKCG